MPPEIVSQSHPVITIPSQRYHRGVTKRWMITKKKKLIPLLFFALSVVSILGLLNTFVIAPFSSPPRPDSVSNEGPSKSTEHFSTGRSRTLTGKEFQLLSKIISLRAPCNLLVFGLGSQYLNLSSSINSRGTTVFLEDHPLKLKRFKTNQKNTRIYRVKYWTLARDAYKLLKQARQDPGCTLGSVRKSSCPLALMKLPREVYARRWEVVVVDGPRGDTPDSPGRMAAIYTAGVMARAENGTTDVVVHDVDRIIEKWFAWEFLCDDNLVSSKGRVWNFRIAGNSDPEKFCKDKTSLVQ